MRAPTGLRTKRPLVLALQGFLTGTFMVALVTHGHWASAIESGVGIGIASGAVGLAYRAVLRLRGSRNA